MLSDENNKQYDSKKQTYIYNTLPHALKQYFKNAIKNTLTYSEKLSNLDENIMKSRSKHLSFTLSRFEFFIGRTRLWVSY